MRFAGEMAGEFTKHQQVTKNLKHERKTKMEKKTEIKKVTEIYSANKVAEMLEVKEAFVKRLLRERQLEGFKLGKFWRVTQESLDDYCAKCGKNGNGRHAASDQVRNKIKFHASLRSADFLPGTVERLNQEISDLKRDLQSETGHRKVAMIEKLRIAVTLREKIQKKLEGLDTELKDLGSKAYPDVAALVDTSPDALEELFTITVREPKKRMVDLLDRKVIERPVEKKAEGSDEEKPVLRVAAAA